MSDDKDFTRHIKATLKELEEEIDKLDEEAKKLGGKLRDGMDDGIEKLRDFMHGGAQKLKDLDQMDGVDEQVRKAVQDNMAFVIDMLTKLLSHLQILLRAAKEAQDKASANDNNGKTNKQ